MNSRQLKENLEGQRQELQGISDQKKSINSEIEALQEKRTQALKAYALGDASQGKEISQLDEQIKPLALRLEALQVLKVDKEAEVRETGELLKKTEKQEAVDLQEFLKKETFNKCQVIRENLNDRRMRILDHYTAICEELAGNQIDYKWLIAEKNFSQELEQSWISLLSGFNETMQRNGLMPFKEAGYIGNLEPWAHLRVDSEYLKTFNFDVKSISPDEYLVWLRQQWVNKMTEQWRQEKGL